MLASGVGRFGRRAWLELGLAEELLEAVGRPDPSPYLPSRLAVGELACDSVALSALALNLAAADRAGTGGPEPVALDGVRVATSFQSERHLRVDGERPDVWSPLSGFFKTADGWVRTHANYPHHGRALRALLGASDTAAKDDVARLIAERGAKELEDKAAEAGAIVFAVRSAQEWREHPHARALAGTPLVRARIRAEGPPRPWRGDGGLPLSGVRVLDLTRVIAGPVATRDLAFAGADVLRLDSPHLPEFPWQHLDTGHGKRSALLDLRSRAGRAALDDLLKRADAVVTGYRPGALAPYGLAPDDLLDRFPGLVVGTVSAWGDTGPWAGRRGFDSIVQAVSGIALIESPDGVTPGALPAQALDHAAGHLLAAALTTSLTRSRTAHVSLSLARLALELLAHPAQPTTPATQPPPTTQTFPLASGPLTTPLPAFTYAHGPSTHPSPAPWSTATPTWL
ncbi:CoA transferase [Actinocorallia sp. A-T 12471]|uniref:CoA transferase n=1 Tax=Actinocorallia sp. A-T 12471 TaxID=3089813 RepID=UPI0029CBF912|nr:CoA transferase [Actinocorallia sp. A-T 12471]MDX6739634.1 CoA transferase [Actinocorallia sp. A-T 12471]